MMPNKCDFITLADYNRDEIDHLLDLAKTMKAQVKEGIFEPRLKNKVLGLVFHKPSLRTRLSFEVGMYQLGGNAVYITDKEIGFGKRESIYDIGHVMSRFLDGIMIRTFDQNDVVQLAKASSIPIINGLTDQTHPCQVLSDLLSISEKGVPLDGIKVAYLGDGNNMVHSWLNACRAYDIDFWFAGPEGYDPNTDLVEAIQMEGRGQARITRSAEEAVAGAHVIYTDTWTSMGQEEEAAKRREVFPPYQLNAKLLAKADSKCLVMHCLPAHRGEEITDEVMDGPNSIVFDQAENRLHAQKAILVHAMSNR
ncbi:MAG: ornithine carbamoyltransferase [Candidatus Eisenbacteria bacterium]|uniref:Ornithine carbamoyltransferase n=1 Tax=Eiseniibacteriota bacterium TaxID=2212470 RepID=A0A956NI61_UNCEI|nr:ornithine carbamoyltransferase [Candidatus Eisenbacteria bacterium]MCB9462843.1 ornithine carbamoyltransferase [Candidatus Eisenbacteria bacterium]